MELFKLLFYKTYLVVLKNAKSNQTHNEYCRAFKSWNVVVDAFADLKERKIKDSNDT